MWSSTSTRPRKHRTTTTRGSDCVAHHREEGATKPPLAWPRRRRWRIPKVPDIIPQAATLAEQPHEAIQSSYRSRYRLARLSAISENQLSRFTHDKVGLSLSSIDRLCRALGLELRPKDE